MKGQSKECTNCGAWTKSDLLDVETGQPVCRPCHNKSFDLYRKMLMEAQKKRLSEVDILPPQDPEHSWLYYFFFGTDESFEERMERMEREVEIIEKQLYLCNVQGEAT